MSDIRCGECSCNWADTGRNERMEEMWRLLVKSEEYVDQTPGRSDITGLQHALRCGWLAREHADAKLAFIGLVHDLARPLNDVHHGEIMAEMVRDRVDDWMYDILRTHGQFQSAIVHDTDFPFQRSVWYDKAILLAEIELASFSDTYQGEELTMHEAKELLLEFLR